MQKNRPVTPGHVTGLIAVTVIVLALFVIALMLGMLGAMANL